MLFCGLVFFVFFPRGGGGGVFYTYLFTVWDALSEPLSLSCV